MGLDVRTTQPARRDDIGCEIRDVCGAACSAGSAIEQVRRPPFSDWIVLTGVSRSPLYDPTALELLRMRHLRLRTLQHIPGMRF